MGGGLELGHHIRVHRDHYLLLIIHQVVAFLNLLVDPFPELISNHRGADVHQPLLGNFWQVDVIWQVVEDHRLVGQIKKDLFHRKILVLWYIESLNPLVLDSSLSSSGDILEEIDGDIVYSKKDQLQKFVLLTVRWKVDITLKRQERIAFPDKTAMITKKTLGTNLLLLNLALNSLAEIWRQDIGRGGC